MVEITIKETTGSSIYLWRWQEGGKQLLMVSEHAEFCLSLTHPRC